MRNAAEAMPAVFADIDARRDAYLEELFPLLRIPSVSRDRENVRHCADALAEMMGRMGIRTQIYQTSGNPIVYGELGERRDVPTVLVYGHYDVQPPDPLDLWTTPPFEPVVRDGRIWGRGTADDKGQFFANLKGIEAYRRVIGDLPVRLKFLYEGEEEVSSPSLKPFVEAHRELLAGDILFGSDSHVHESGNPRLNLGNKGMLYVEIRLRGANRDLHSQMAAMVPNPIWRLVGLLATLKGEDGIVRIDGFYDDVRPPLELEREAVRRIPCDKAAILRDLGLPRLLQNRTGDDFYYNQIFEPTANIAGIFGGYTGPDKKTVLPGRVAVKMDLRLVPNQRSADILEKLRRHLEARGYGDAEIAVLGTAEPNRVPMDHPFVPLFRAAIAEVWGAEPIVCPNVGGTNPNWIFGEVLGMKDFKVPLALADENAHAPNENFPVACMLRGMKMTANLLAKFAARDARQG